MLVSDQRLSGVHLDAKFFAQFALQPLERLFAGLDFAAGKFPAASHMLARRPLREEHAAAYIEHRAGDDVNQP